ncbi:TRAP transporter small permease subunit [Denitrobaculum tricleocarpae]|uniref:TRAP transporter small permease protein n=1 Tax=Denitrobaculum tricleocarpae TaxID=2591009 RepID=A0A545TXF8_9PROT|nr:TRAP transporter small permease subunit [Denitrobaculum tricleocarpae]TQV81909.1 TRAP transporter small permease subunit [Denitrobaculum tricleocarpae]
MEQLVKISDFLDKVITKIAKVAAWAGVALILVTIFDVVTRRFFVLGSTKLQELEWHFHTILFAFCLGFAYLKDSHVRIDIVRERLSERTQWWIELSGCLFFLLPYCALVTYFAYDFTVRSFQIGEISASATGLSHRWIIKSAIPIGFALLGLSGIVITLRKIVELFGPPDLRKKVHDTEEQEVEHLDDMTDIPRPAGPAGTAGSGG